MHGTRRTAFELQRTCPVVQCGVTGLQFSDFRLKFIGALKFGGRGGRLGGVGLEIVV